MSAVQAAKQALRKEIKRRVAALSDDEKHRQSRALSRKVGQKVHARLKTSVWKRKDALCGRQRAPLCHVIGCVRQLTDTNTWTCWNASSLLAFVQNKCFKYSHCFSLVLGPFCWITAQCCPLSSGQKKYFSIWIKNKNVFKNHLSFFTYSSAFTYFVLESYLN